MYYKINANVSAENVCLMNKGFALKLHILITLKKSIKAVISCREMKFAQSQGLY